jgi:hypothetical protein
MVVALPASKLKLASAGVMQHVLEASCGQLSGLQAISRVSRSINRRFRLHRHSQQSAAYALLQQYARVMRLRYLCAPSTPHGEPRFHCCFTSHAVQALS